MINRERRAAQIVLGATGLPGIEEKLVAVPFRPPKITDLGVVYNITKEQAASEKPAIQVWREIGRIFHNGVLTRREILSVISEGEVTP
jgi:hypothetical protein